MRPRPTHPSLDKAPGLLSRRGRPAGAAKGNTRLVLLSVLGVFGVGGYAVSALGAGAKSLVPAPSITAKPASGTWRTSARFAYADRWHGGSFECSLDRARFSWCTSAMRYPGPLAGGFHRFEVRAVGWFHHRRALSSPASYRWLVDLRPPAPYIALHPVDPTSSRRATFAFTDGEPRVKLQCRLTGSWTACSSPVTYSQLSVGPHEFQVRAVDPPAHPSPVARFHWRVVAQSSTSLLSIGTGQVVGGPLYPGAAPQEVAVTLANPGDSPIFVTGVTVTVADGPAGCESATNLSLVQSNVTDASPVEIPGHNSVTLPAQGDTAPTIRLVNLPVNQDACQHASFALNVTGSAHS